jgi:hypothetical protein
LARRGEAPLGKEVGGLPRRADEDGEDAFERGARKILPPLSKHRCGHGRDHPPTTAVAPATMTPRETRKTAIVRSKMAKALETDMTNILVFSLRTPGEARGVSDLDNA